MWHEVIVAVLIYNLLQPQFFLIINEAMRHVGAAPI